MSVLEEGTINCNSSCCQMSSGTVICFGEYNFTDTANITHPASWEMAIRWSFVSLIMLMAVLGNLAIIIILTKNHLLLRHSINCFILNMSVADLITALAGPIPFTIKDTAYFWVLGRTWCHLEGYVQMLVMLVSVTSLATISFDRMMGVVRPFHTHLKIWQSVAIIAIIWVVSAVIALPFAFYRIYTVHQWQDLTQTTCGEDTKKMNVWWMVSMLGLTWLPLFIMLCCYTTILVYFRTSKFKTKTHGEHPTITHMKRKVVIMMFSIVIAFSVFWLPFQMLKICGSLFFEESQFKNPTAEKAYNILYPISHYMIYTNVAVNPIIYGLMHQTFRRAFKVTFPCFYRGKSAFVLTPGEGRQHYVWSMRTESNAYSHMLSMSRQQQQPSQCGHRMMEVMSTAVVCSSTLAASIAIEPVIEETQIGDSSEQPRETQERGAEIAVVGNKSVPTLTVTRPSAPPADEMYVWDLRPRELSIVSTGTLGQLITQVIEEESSSDAEGERIL
ncbi:Substance-K receptor [Chionoecetes opilio]|uniref:Substance-K receptor n=1 Tax=Chionoecetes opilio TaxID=41210 RepID=A0A8J4YJG9_CHIOP|nr:Substance-K receptor [Chionoecetes opilio]